MRIDYDAAISESEEQLAAKEWELRGQRRQARVRMPRLLKSGAASSLPTSAPLVGYGLRPLSRW